MILTEKFEVHKSLNPKLWTSDNKLQNEVKLKLLEIVQQFVDNCEIPLNVSDVHLVGSNASYNYTAESDLDVHIISNFGLIDAPKEILQAAYNALKTKFNNDYDISVHGVPIELYVEDINSTTLSNGVYSMIEDKWIKFPKPITSIPEFDLTDRIKELNDEADFAIKSNNSDNIENLINKLYLIRKNSLDVEGEYGEGNQLFKELRSEGTLDKLKAAYKTARSGELTLEKYLREDSRANLISKSKRSQKGFERFKKRVKSRVANTVKQYNAIDMNKLFKQDILTVDVQVRGETDTYTVKISFGGFCELLHDQIESSGQLNLKAVTRALVNGFNRNDVYIHCSCPDSQYRFSYWQTKNKVNSGEEENRPANITNPHDSLGTSCKHVLLVLSNESWLLKVASVIYNYINYMEKHYKKLYADFIYPAVYQKDYEEPVQLDMFDDDELATDSDTIDTSNRYAATKNQFKPGNDYRFKPGEDKNQIKLDAQPSAMDAQGDEDAPG